MRAQAFAGGPPDRDHLWRGPGRCAGDRRHRQPPRSSSCRIVRSMTSSSRVSRGKRPVESVRGRILYDFSGNACEGYALQFRQVSELNTGEGSNLITDLRADDLGRRRGEIVPLQFAKLHEREARRFGRRPRRAQGGRHRGQADQARRQDASNLDSALIFPTEHMRRIIAAARAGKTMLEFRSSTAPKPARRSMTR